MSSRPTEAPLEDAVDLLLPGAPEGERTVARELATTFRLAAIETADARSPSTGIEPGLAQAALREHDLGEALLGLQDVLIHHAGPCRRPSSFAVLPRPRAPYTESLRSLLKLLGRRSEDLQFRLPTPETPRRVALLDLLEVMKAWVRHPEASEAQAAQARLWEARCLHNDGELARARELLEDILSGLPGGNDRVHRRFRAEVLAELVSLHMDAGELEEAKRAVERGGPSPRLPADVRWNLDALALALDWLAGGSSFPALDGAFLRSGLDVPGGWREVLKRVEPQRPATQRAPLRAGAEGTADGCRALPSRSELGAQAVVFLVIDDQGRLRRGAADVAPALEGAVDQWVRRWRHVDTESRSILQAALRGSEPEIVMSGAPGAGSDESLRCSCIDAERGYPQAVIALPLEQGHEVVGLLWLEFGSRMLPGAARLKSVAERAVGHPMLRHRVGAAVRLGEEEQGQLALEEQSVRRDLRRLWAELVDELALKTAERRWVAFQRVGSIGDLVPVASGGAGGGRLGEPSSGGLWAIRRVLAGGGFLRYESDQDDGRSSMLHPGAAAGVAIAVPGFSGVEAVLIIESARGGDSRERDAIRWAEVLERRSNVLQCGALDHRDRVHHGGGLVLDARAPDELKRLTRIQVLASNRSDLIIRGEAGCGRRTVARAVHHARRARSGREELAQLSCFGIQAADLEGAFADDSVETVVLTDIDRLDVDGQVTLARLLDRDIQERPRLVATGATSPARATTPSDEAGSGGLAESFDPTRHPDLHRNLGRVEFLVQPLRHVRHRIPPLARALAARWERSARPGVPMLWSGESDGVESVLWRQPWEGNAVELEAVVRQALLRAEGAAVEVADLMAAFRDVGLVPLSKLPSRSPDVRDVASALWTTRTATGRVNKTRAAAYCGWDPNTLAARLRDMGISELQDAERLLEDSSA